MRDTSDRNPMDAGTIILAAIVASAIGALFYNVLPLYLGSAQDYKGLDNRAVGFLTSSFFLGYNVVTISAFFWIRRVSWRAVTAGAFPVAALMLYAGTLVDSYSMLLVLVATAGGAFAAIYGIGTTMLGDTSNPARWYGLKIAAEAVFGVLLLFALPSLAIARWGFDGTIFGMIIVMLILAPFLIWIPKHGIKGAGSSGPYAAESTADTTATDARQSPYIWGLIIATFVFFTGASSIWAFLERIGANNGHEPETVGMLLSATLVFAVLGSLGAAALGGRFGNVKPFVAGATVFAVAMFVLDSSHTITMYAAGACMTNFAFGFMLPIAITEIADLDVDGRYVILSVPAIGLGAMAGPAIAGLLTQSNEFRPLLVFGAMSVIVASALIAFSAWKSVR